MASAVYRQQGCIQQYTPTAAKSAGDPVSIDGGRRAGIVVRDIAANAEGQVYIEGVFEITRKASTAIAEGAIVWWDATNSRADLTAVDSSSFILGIAAKASVSADTTQWVDLNASATMPGIMRVEKAVVTGAGTVQIYNANCPSKFRVVDMWFVCTDANAGTVKLTDGTNDITNAVTHGTTDKAVVRVGTIDDAYWDLAPGATLNVVAATGGASVVFVALLPI